MRINIKIDTDLFFECGFKFSFQSLYKLINLPVAFIILLAITDKDVIIISFNNA
jgi:hypothetical protein